jgi:hypothetical protein
MRIMKRGLVAALVAGSMAGGAVGATVISAASSGAANTTSTTANTTSGSAAAPDANAGGPPNGGKFVPNENSSHEKGESAQREAQESAGQFPTVP